MTHYIIPRKKLSTEAERTAFWKGLLEDQQKSTLTMIDFCRTHQLPLSTFKAWKYRFKKQEKSEAFIPVQIATIKNSNQEFSTFKVTIQFKNGHYIQLQDCLTNQLLDIFSYVAGCPC